MSGIVRQSKYRHVFGQASKTEKAYQNLKLSLNAWDTNYVTCNVKFFSIIWQAAGGGSFAVIPNEKVGKLDTDYPLVAGHKSEVLDIHFNPFNDNIIASVSGDGTGKIWRIPDGGLKETLREPVQNLRGHKRQVGTVRWNPTANNVLVTSAKDYVVKIWDAESGTDKLTVGEHGNIIQSTEWNYDGSQLATASKDKKVRLVDPRQQKVTGEVEAHQGVKGMRCAFLGSSGKLLTVGFSRTSDRQFAIWDPKNLGKALITQNVDTAAGMLMPFYDNDTGLLFLAGKGDGNVRYYETNQACDQIWYINDYKSNVPQRGMDMFPKIGVNVSDCEVVRLLKVTNDVCEPISFIVPRRGAEDQFQDDLYPDTASGQPSVSGPEWFNGSSAAPKLVSLAGGFAAKDRPQSSFNVSEVQSAEDHGPAAEDELRAAWKKQRDRIAFLEAELARKDGIIKQLGGK